MTLTPHHRLGVVWLKPRHHSVAIVILVHLQVVRLQEEQSVQSTKGKGNIFWKMQMPKHSVG